MLERLRRRVRAWRGSGRGREGGATPERESIDTLRARAGTGVVDVDTALRDSRDELDLAIGQVGRDECARYVSTLESARALAQEAFALHTQAGELARTDRDGTAAERLLLEQTIDLTRRSDALLEADAADFARLRELSARVPALLDELALRADDVERTLPGARERLETLSADHDHASLSSVADSLPSATRCVAAARELIASGRAHLANQDLSSAVAAVRGAEGALGRAQTEVASVDAARAALATAEEDLRAALNSIHADLRDVRRLSADDARTTAAVSRAEPVIAAGTTVLLQGGDRLAALAALTLAEQDIDDALVEHRVEAAQHRRAVTRLERRVRNTEAFVAGVDRRVDTWRGGSDTATRTRIADAARLVREARAQASADPAAATALLDQAVEHGKAVQQSLDAVVHDDAATAYRREQGSGGDVADGLLGLAVGGLLGLGTGGWGGSSGGGSGSHGGGGRF